MSTVQLQIQKISCVGVLNDSKSFVFDAGGNNVFVCFCTVSCELMFCGLNGSEATMVHTFITVQQTSSSLLDHHYSQKTLIPQTVE